jgi:hypothetical protein
VRITHNPPTLNEQDAIVRQVRKGRPLYHAARRAGLDPILVKTWLTRGRTKMATQANREFARAIAAAELTFLVGVLALVHKAATRGNDEAAAAIRDWLQAPPQVARKAIFGLAQAPAATRRRILRPGNPQRSPN